jgi:hypothetical protein
LEGIRGVSQILNALSKHSVIQSQLRLVITRLGWSVGIHGLSWHEATLHGHSDLGVRRRQRRGSGLRIS